MKCYQFMKFMLRAPRLYVASFIPPQQMAKHLYETMFMYKFVSRDPCDWFLDEDSTAIVPDFL